MVLTIDFLYFNIIHLLCISPPMCSDRATSRAGNTNYTDRSNMILFRLVQTVREIGGCMSVRLAALPARGRRPVDEQVTADADAAAGTATRPGRCRRADGPVGIRARQLATLVRPTGNRNAHNMSVGEPRVSRCMQ